MLAPVEAAEFTDLLRRHGHRVTRPRRAVFEALAASPDHLTVEELHALVRRREPGVNLASVYRSLTLLEELDVARESQIGDGEAAHWELAHPDEHFHVVCDACGAVEHHVGALVEQITEHLRTGHGFEARQVDLTVTGRCRRCRVRHVPSPPSPANDLR